VGEIPGPPLLRRQLRGRKGGGERRGKGGEGRAGEREGNVEGPRNVVCPGARAGSRRAWLYLSSYVAAV